MDRFVSLAIVLVVFVGPVRAFLIRSTWTERAPRASILLWQSIGLAAMTTVFLMSWLVARSSLGAAWSDVGRVTWTTNVDGRQPSPLTPNELFALTAGLIVLTLAMGTLLARTIGLRRARTRHRILLDLLGESSVEAPGAVVLDDERPTAYCLPGIHPRIVVSTGAIDSLSHDELQAVLAHEAAHVHARHDLVLMPFRLLPSIFGARVLRRVNNSLRTLIEMAADDRSMRHHDRVVLAGALCRISTASIPPIALGVADHMTQRRVERALRPRVRTVHYTGAALLGATLAPALPLVVALLTQRGA